MGPDPRIADYIRDNRKQYTREAITQQLVDAGYAPEAIAATWKVLDTPDPDDVAGEGIWRRFFQVIIGINVAVLVLVGLATGSFFASDRLGLLGVLAVVLAIGALIAWGIVAAVGPARLGRTTATVIAIVIPGVIALLIGGSCYAILASLGPPPKSGTMELQAELPGVPGGTGTATCTPSGSGRGFTVFGQVSTDPSVSVSLDSFSPTGPPTDEVESLYISIESGTETGPFGSYSTGSGQGGQLESEVSRNGLEGTVTFTDLPPDQLGDPESNEPLPDPISGSVTWSCEE